LETNEEDLRQERLKLTPEQRKENQAKALERGRKTRERKNICNYCGTQGHFGKNCHTLKDAECARCGNKGHYFGICPNKPKRKRMDEEMDKQTERDFELAKHIIKETPKMIKKEKVIESIRKFNSEKVNYLGRNGKPRYIPVTCEVNIQGEETEAIIDSGAAATVISKGLLDKTPYRITKSSRASFNPFGGKGKYVSLGVVEDMKFMIGDVNTTMDVEVVDIDDEIFILGVEWCEKEKANIDIGNRIMEIRQKERTYEVPIKYVKKEELEEYETDEDSLY
jgi:hypothetical protein